MQHSSVVAFDGRKERASPLLLFLVLGPVEIGQVIKKTAISHQQNGKFYSVAHIQWR